MLALGQGASYLPYSSKTQAEAQRVQYTCPRMIRLCKALMCSLRAGDPNPDSKGMNHMF